MTSRQTRFDRLSSLLPRVYAAQPQGSAVGELLNIMAGALATLDRDLEVVLRDRWFPLSSQVSLDDDYSIPLELLGQGIDIEAQSYELEEPDGARVQRRRLLQAYKRRLALTAEVITSGLTTPRAILVLATIALDTELCPRLKRDRDSTIGRGMRPGTRSHCPGCQGQTNGDCPSKDAKVLDAWVTDNPPTARRLRKGPLSPGETFLVRSHSLYPDLPVITMRAASDAPLVYPAVQNHGTQEVVLYAGNLTVGETLLIRPRVEASEIESFNGHETVGHHPWHTLEPSGRALIIASDGSRDVSEDVYYMRGYAFAGADEDDDSPGLARFATHEDTEEEPRFAALREVIRTPQVRSGEDNWVYRSLTREEVEAIAESDDDDRRKSLRDRLLSGAPDEPSSARAEVTLEWWTRPLATFRLRIPKNPVVRMAEERGVEGQGPLDLLRSSVESARAAGVRAIIDFPEPTRHELQAATEQVAINVHLSWAEPAGAQDRLISVTAGDSYREEATVQDAFGIQGIFDVTRLDWTRLAP